MNRPQAVSMLIVDDNADLCGLLASVLRARGFVVDQCVDADVAIEQVKTHNYSAILVEPSPTAGLRPFVDYLAATRSDRLGSVVLATTERDEMFDAVIGESGVFRILHKPISAALLCSTMTECAERRDAASV